MMATKRMIQKFLACQTAVSMAMSLLTISASAEAAITGTGTPEDPRITVEVNITPAPGTGGTETETVTQKEWATPHQDESSGEPGPSQEGAVRDVSVSGSEITQQTVVTDALGRPLSDTDSVVGEESVNATVTATDITTLEDQLISDTSEERAPVTTETVDGAPETTEGKWIKGETKEGEWVEGETKAGRWSGSKTMASSSDTSDAGIDDPLDEGDITIRLKPGTASGPYTRTETVTISLAEIVKDNLAIPALGSKTEGNVTTETKAIYASDGKTVIGYEIVRTTTTEKTDTEDVSGKQPTEEPESGDDIVEIKTAPEGYAAGTVESIGEHGEKIRTVTEEIVENGKVVGYKITRTTTITNSASGTVTTESTAATITEEGEHVETFTLPEKPAESVSTDEITGVTTTVTVEEILDNGKVVGYQATTVKTDRNGGELSRDMASVYGTTRTVRKTTVTEGRHRIGTS